MTLGLGLPNCAWRVFSQAEVDAVLDLRPGACLSIVFHDSPVLGAKIDQEAWLWQQLGQPPWTCRFYTGPLQDWKPEDLAFELYILDQKYRARGMSPRWTPWNEANIEGFGEDWERLISFAVAVEAGVHMYNPKIPLDLPALSPTGNYRQGLEAMAKAGL